eukprot:scaffold67516_cov28-Tisochrysis_lutea.AAC.5
MRLRGPRPSLVSTARRSSVCRTRLGVANAAFLHSLGSAVSIVAAGDAASARAGLVVVLAF